MLGVMVARLVSGRDAKRAATPENVANAIARFAEDARTLAALRDAPVAGMPEGLSLDEAFALDTRPQPPARLSYTGADGRCTQVVTRLDPATGMYCYEHVGHPGPVPCLAMTPEERADIDAILGRIDALLTKHRTP